VVPGQNNPKMDSALSGQLSIYGVQLNAYIISMAQIKVIKNRTMFLGISIVHTEFMSMPTLEAKCACTIVAYTHIPIRTSLFN
jgi:hypothetical protein